MLLEPYHYSFANGSYLSSEEEFVNIIALNRDNQYLLTSIKISFLYNMFYFIMTLHFYANLIKWKGKSYRCPCDNQRNPDSFTECAGKYKFPLATVRIPVSYTHLDVYKRQSLFSVLKKKDNHYCKLIKCYFHKTY